jgi:hypothetical protein
MLAFYARQHKARGASEDSQRVQLTDEQRIDWPPT